ncbi:MAG: hypothetical protein H7Y14_01305 [Burkholderiales bacterium]|nr:hypothetical protein [Burkholderiales bacterium]
MRPRRLFSILVLLGAAFAGALAWAAFTPAASDSREAVYEIPKGTWARRMAGEKLDILPQELRLVMGVRDILVLRNQDDVPQVFGPVLIMPGQTFSMPFRQAATYQFACSLHVSGQLSVVVEPAPAIGWERLRWRIAGMGSRMAWL